MASEKVKHIKTDTVSSHYNVNVHLYQISIVRLFGSDDVNEIKSHQNVKKSEICKQICMCLQSFELVKNALPLLP